MSTGKPGSLPSTAFESCAAGVDELAFDVKYMQLRTPGGEPMVIKPRGGFRLVRRCAQPGCSATVEGQDNGPAFCPRHQPKPKARRQAA